MIKPLYKSFIPYVLLMVAILIGTSVFDNFAQRLSMEPEIITLRKTEDTYESDLFSLPSDEDTDQNSGTPGLEDTLYTQALVLFRKQQYREADEKLSVLLSRNDGSAKIWDLRGRISVRLMEYAGAERNFQTALEMDPGFTGARINLASLYTSMLRHKEAEQQYETALLLDPNNPAIYFYMGLLYNEMHQMDAAGDAFRTAAGLSSGERKSKALCQLGMVLLTQKDTLSARKELDEAILLSPGSELARLQLALTFSDQETREAELLKIYNLNPSSFQANYYLGNLYGLNGRTAQAEHHYRKALEKMPNDERVMKELGNLLISQQRMEEAELVLSGFTAGDTLPQAYFYQAKMAAGEGDKEAAIKLYMLAAEKANHNYPEAYLNRGILCKEQGRAKQAIESYRNAIKADPHYSLAYYNLALLYTDLDSTDRAIDCYLKSIQFDPEALKSWYNLGRIYDDLKDTEKAIDAYQNAHLIDPGYQRALLALGNAYMRSERNQQAIDCYLELLVRYPNYSKAQFNLGLAYTRNDEPLKAVEVYERLIEVDPENVRARINLALLYARTDELDLAVSTLEDAMYIEMDNPDIRYNLALQLNNLGRPQEAIHHLLQAIQLDAGYRAAYTELMTIYNELGNEVDFETVRFMQQKQFPDQGDFYATGKRLIEVGRPELALEAFALARERGDDRNWLYYWTGKAYLDLMSVEEAMKWFTLTLERDANHKFSLYRMGQALEMQGDSARAATYYSLLLELDPGFKIVHKSPLSGDSG